METTILNAALTLAGAPPLTSEMLSSVDLSESEKKSKPSHPTICLSYPTESAHFRRGLFGLDESHHAKVESLARAGEWFTRSCVHNDRRLGYSLMLSGDPGVGKTHVAKAVYRYIQSFGVDICFLHGGKHPMPLWLDWQRLAELEKESAFEDVLYEVSRSRVIFIDDIGAESDRFRSGIGASRLRTLLARAEQKWILATTNLDKAGLFSAYDARVVDRVRAFRWLSMKGVPSYRARQSKPELKEVL